ncbi:MAG: hypothetical protein ACRC7N_18880 [Clostridium sp.]
MNKNKQQNIIFLCFTLLSVLIISFVLFKTPHAGVADQGDFDRVMSASGLGLTDEVKSDPNFNRFFQYTVTDYKIENESFGQMIVNTLNTTMSLPIRFISFICTILGSSVFKTEYLAIYYGIVYVLAIILILKFLDIKNTLKLALISILTLFVFFDGNYIVWFNSLYGEPMMLTTLLLFFASIMYYNKTKDNKDKIWVRILLIIGSSLLMLGSKLQLITAIPIILLIVGFAMYDNKQYLSKISKITLSFLLFATVCYPVILSSFNTGIANDNNYNAVFYGVLNGSEDPRQDLIDMGLDPDMASEAGKHAYEPVEKYVKYIPRTALTEEVFYKNMGRSKLVKFYLTHPVRFFEGMEYTADSAYYTSTALGKYNEGDVSEPISKFDRFTTWSYIRENHLPRSFIFIAIIFAIAILISIYMFIKNKSNKSIKDKIYLYWCLLYIAILQYPMPYVGNGRADTAKQLYLFNFIFDIILLSIVYFIISTLINKLSRRNANA